MGAPRHTVFSGRRVGLLLLSLLACSGVATAHEVGGSRFDAPIPLPLLFAGAGVTVAATAGWLAVSSNAAPSEPAAPARAECPIVTIPPSLARAVEYGCRYGFFLLFLLAIADGLLGSQVAAENVATVFVWPVWLKGVAVVAALLGSPWRVISPWGTLYAGLVRLERGEVSVLGPYPSWLGSWPALVAFVGWIGVAENLTVLPRSPTWTTLLIAGYAAITLLGAIAYGEPWLERADVFAVLYRLFGRVAPLAVDRTSAGGASISARYPWRDCTRAVHDGSLVGFVVATVYTVSFDGFTSTLEYQSILFRSRDALGLGPGTGVLLYVLGLALFLSSFAAVVALADAAGGRLGPRRALLAFAPTVLPIAVAYEVAHNYPYVARNLGQLGAVLGGFVVAEPPLVEPLAWLSLPGFWTSQVLLIVVGHVVAVVAAHAVTLDRYPSRRLATRAHVPVTAIMVGYTVLSLWIISRPVVG